jgi:hypothetical protein
MCDFLSRRSLADQLNRRHRRRLFDDREIPYVIEVKSNRIAETHGRKKIGKKLTSFFKDKIRQLILFKNRQKFASEAVVTLRDSGAPVKIVAVANRRDLDDEVFAYYASNQPKAAEDLNLAADQTLQFESTSDEQPIGSEC